MRLYRATTVIQAAALLRVSFFGWTAHGLAQYFVYLRFRRRDRVGGVAQPTIKPFNRDMTIVRYHFSGTLPVSSASELPDPLAVPLPLRLYRPFTHPSYGVEHLSD